MVVKVSASGRLISKLEALLIVLKETLLRGAPAKLPIRGLGVKGARMGRSHPGKLIGDGANGAGGL